MRKINVSYDKKAETVTFRGTLPYKGWFLTFQTTRYSHYYPNMQPLQLTFENCFYYPEADWCGGEFDKGTSQQDQIENNNYCYWSGKKYEILFCGVILLVDRNHRRKFKVFNESEPELSYMSTCPPLNEGKRLDYLDLDFVYHYNCFEGEYEGIPLLVIGDDKGGYLDGYEMEPEFKSFSQWLTEHKPKPTPKAPMACNRCTALKVKEFCDPEIGIQYLTRMQTKEKFTVRKIDRNTKGVITTVYGDYETGMKNCPINIDRLILARK
jgi:hypothetical protein